MWAHDPDEHQVKDEVEMVQVAVMLVMLGHNSTDKGFYIQLS